MLLVKSSRVGTLRNRERMIFVLKKAMAATIKKIMAASDELINAAKY